MNVDIQKALQDWERKYNLNHVNRAYGEQYHRIVSANEIMDLCNRIAQTAQEQLNELAKLIPDCYYMDSPDGGATSLQEQFRRAMEDASLLRFIESQGDGSGWVARDSTTGRGHRVHNSARSTLSLRDAIKAYADAFASEPEHAPLTAAGSEDQAVYAGIASNYHQPPAQQQAEPVAWEYREFHDDNTVTPGWGKWKRIESEEWAGRSIESVVADIHEFIAQGYRYELRALYAQSPAVVVAVPVAKVIGVVDSCGDGDDARYFQGLAAKLLRRDVPEGTLLYAQLPVAQKGGVQ